MMEWVLIIVVNASVSMQRFPNAMSCESARNWVRAHTVGSEAVCLPDLREEEPKVEPLPEK